MNGEKLYTVKDVLEFCRITRKQLLYYEEKGLVESIRNPDNNYRYYTKSEILKIAFVSECRRIGFDIKLIKDMLTDNSVDTLKKSILQSMENAREELNRSITKYEESMKNYSLLLEAALCIPDNNQQQDKIELIEIPAKNIVYYDYIGSFYDDVFEFYKHFSELEKIIEKYNFTKTSTRRYQFLGHFDSENGEFYKDNSKIRLFYEVKENMPHCKNFMLTKPCRALSAISVGDYCNGLQPTYKKIIDYAQNNGIKLNPISVEEALIDCNISYKNSSLWVTRVNIFLGD